MKHGKYLLFLFLAQLIYAANYTIAKEVMPAYISPFGFIFSRVLMGLILFWIFKLIFVPEKIKSKKDFGLLAIGALFGVGINMLSFFAGLAITSPINASIIMITTPILVSILAYFISKEKLSKINLLGIVIGFLGAFLLIIKSGNSDKESSLLGDFLIFVNATSYAIYLVMIKPIMQKYHPITVVAWVFTFGMIYISPFCFQDFLAARWQDLNFMLWLDVAYVLIGATFLAYLFNSLALSKLKSSVVGSFIYLQPVLATSIAVLSSKYDLYAYQIFFGVMIFIGVYLVSLNKKNSS